MGGGPIGGVSLLTAVAAGVLLGGGSVSDGA